MLTVLDQQLGAIFLFHLCLHYLDFVAGDCTAASNYEALFDLALWILGNLLNGGF
jgi:hypothetical protein